MDPSFFMDHPTERKIHDRPKPRFGGLAFGPIIIILGWFLLNGAGHLTWYFLGAIAIFILGAVDDYWTISWHVKLPVQLFVGFLVVIQFLNHIESISFFSLVLPENQWILIGLYVFWFIGILNAMNLIDGMDGLAGGFVFLSSFACIILGWYYEARQFMYINAIIMGAMIAFLHFNQKPSKFFMGDSGSLLLGFHIATLPLQMVSSLNGIQTIDMTPFILLTSYLIIDTTRVFYIRIYNKRHPLEPDQSHLHHIMLKNSGSYNGTLLSIFFFLGISGITALIYTMKNLNIIYMYVYFAIILLVVLVPKIMDSIVFLLTRIIQSIKTNEIEYDPMRLILRVRYLPFITILYFAGILLVSPGLNQMNTVSALLVLSSVIILAFIFSGTNIHYRSEVLIIGIGIIQSVFVFNLYSSDTSFSNGILIQTGNILRYGSLLFISVVTFMNYILHGKRIPGEFWSATDLLIIIILAGRASIKSIGFGIPVFMSFELGIIYLSNKLYVPRILLGSLLAPQNTR